MFSYLCMSWCCGTALQGVVGTTTDTMTDVEEVVLAARVTDIGVAVVPHLRGGIVMTSGDAADTMIAILPAIVVAIVMCVVTGKFLAKIYKRLEKQGRASCFVLFEDHSKCYCLRVT